MTKTLMQIEQDAIALESLLLESGGELNETLENWLAEVETALAVKVDSYAAVLDRFEASEKYMKEKAAQYSQAAKVLANTRDRLKDRIKQTIQNMGVAEVKGSHTTFKLTKSTPSLVLDESRVPKIYQFATIAYQWDKDRIKEQLKLGAVEGAQLVENFALRKSVTKG